MKKILLYPEADNRNLYCSRRSYPRVPFEHSVRFLLCSHQRESVTHEGHSENVSQAGMLFRSKVLPPLSSLILIDTYFDDLMRCIDLDQLLMTSFRNVLAKVVQISHEKKKDFFNIGISFVRKEEQYRSDVLEALSHMPTLQSLQI
jgi:hypothetical protein